MEFQILGPVGLRLNGHWLPLGSDKERVLLAALAFEAGRPVALSELIERLWDGEPPTRARENTHTYISRIRRQLRAAGAGPDAPAIVGRAHTYMLRTAPDRVDRGRFQHLVDAAAKSPNDAQAIELLRRAEDLWAGEALAGLPGVWATTARRALAESRLSASSSRIAAGLRLGQFAEHVGELRALVGQRPEDELLLAQLMLAYYGSGRYTDALRVHQRARQRLMSEYGALPGAELDTIHRGVLARVPVRELVLGGGPGRPQRQLTQIVSAPPETPGAVVPPESAAVAPSSRNLPHMPSLIGRRSELRVLRSAIARKDGGGAVVTVEAVSGMAGVGKTALVVTAAHLLAEKYPDGQLYIDLRGHSPTQEPLSARAALATLLRLLGAPAASIPAELEGRTALWRSMLAERRVVIILDDATGPEQVRPLLPSGSSSLTIIASRRHLTGVPQALSVAVDVLPEEDAVALFRSFAGHRRTRDAAETARIVRLCGYLPLAIELVAHRFRTRTSWTLSVLAERLAVSPGRLGEIRSAGQEQEVARAFALSYRTLTAPQRAAFRRLGQHPGPDFTAEAAAALLRTPLDATERLLEDLLACHLLREPTPGRYRYHDLLREYAYGLSVSEDGEPDRREALTRLTRFYVTTADLADRMANPRRVRLAPSALLLPTPAPSLPHPAAARAWLAVERGNLLALESHLRAHGEGQVAARLASSVAGFLQSECYWQDAKRVLQHAVAHWDRTGDDEPALCRALIDLCAADASIGEYAEAATAGERALELARTLGDEPAEAEALRVLGTLNWHLGENRTALVLLQKSSALTSLSGDVWKKARSRNNIAVALLFLGERSRALDYFHDAVTGFREAADQIATAQTLNNIGELQMLAGDTISARHSFEESLSYLEIDGSRFDRATARRNLAEALTELGESEVAIPMFMETLGEFRSLRDRKSQAEALVGIGEACWRLRRTEESRHYLLEALRLAQEIGTAHHEIQALRRIGRADFSVGHLMEASERLRAAVSVAARTSDVDEEVAARTLLAEVRMAAGDAAEARTVLGEARQLIDNRDDAVAQGIRQRLTEIERSSEQA
ncbi:BTAD domain-containing putative transcriptional regulator [Streptomyces sp. NPDC060243]|uniref:AfsR/SARP family transcriptional regulator n=1 Tax=Streptomyces sp. NPDC060243 TaxID=3347081 RepID=UPI003662BAAE